MDPLTKKEKELVALGASLGCNCVPCVVYHVKEALKNGISHEQIKEAIELSDKIRKVSVQRVQDTAYAQIGRQPKKSVDCSDLEKPDCCS